MPIASMAGDFVKVKEPLLTARKLRPGLGLGRRRKKTRICVMDLTYTPGASPIALSPMRSSYPMRMPIIRSRSDGARARVLLPKNNYHLSAGVL